MTVILVFLLVIIGVSGWWLVNQRVTEKPWLEQGVIGPWPGDDVTGMPTAKVGLGVFLAVVGALFALFASAYFMRMELSDWQTAPMPRVLWFNTAILALSSVALHMAVVSARKDHVEATRLALMTGGISALAFLAGQLSAWRELTAEGHMLGSNPANSFFYLLTGLHGLHILGGLVALGRTTTRAWSADAGGARLRLSVELCATYWHFLLLVWLILFVLFAGWADGVIARCAQLLS